MKLGIRSRRIFWVAFPALALCSLMLTAAGPAPAHAEAVTIPGMAITGASANATTYADDGDKGKKKGDKGGTEPIIISPPIIVPDPPKPKKDK